MIEGRIINIPKNISESASELPNMFAEAGRIYNQKSGNFYESRKSINGLHLAVLPERDQYLFTSFSVGDSEDIEILRKLYKDGIFKTYDCTLCAIDRYDNAVNLSDEQNQLVVRPNSPAILINESFKGKSGKQYLITGTVPQYYYNHLLLSSQEHLPTYAVFSDIRVFEDLMEYLRFGSKHVKNLYAFFNGNFGSDIFHFHTHLTNQSSTILSMVAKTFTQNGVFPFYSGLVKLAVFTDNDLTNLRANVFNSFALILDLRNANPDLVITSNFFYRNNRYFVTIQVVNKSINKWSYKNCNFFIFPASFILTSTSCFVPPQTQPEFENFVQSMAQNFQDFYVDPNLYMTLSTINYDATIRNILRQNLPDIIGQKDVEKFYIWMEYKRLNNLMTEKLIHEILQIILSSNCFDVNWNCDWMTQGKFKYMLGIVFNTIDLHTLNHPSVRDLQISAEFHRMNTMNSYGNITNNYMYFRGKYIQHFLTKTIKNLLIITQYDSSRPWNETSEIVKWIKHTFKRIGEASASGVNTIVDLKFPDVDMVMKMMNMYIQDSNGKMIFTPEKINEFTHEFWAGMEVNKIRDLVPNYILTYGGFFCNSSSADTLCDLGPGKNSSYLLLENVKNAETFGRFIKTPKLTYPKEIDDMVDNISQILIALAFGWQEKKFTHYDLHPDNVMIYNFIENKNFLKLFKIYDEYNGDVVPQIKNILFRYYMSAKDPTDQIIISAKYLFLIIDYGNSFVEGMPEGSHFQYPNRYNNLGMTSNKPNLVFDTYTLLMSTFFNILLSKPYLVIENNTWKNNILYLLFEATIRAYSELWEEPAKLMDKLLQIHISGGANRWRLYRDMFTNSIKPQYKINHFQYLSPNFSVNSVPIEFRGARAILQLLIREYYIRKNLKSQVNKDDVYVFNWGHVPSSELTGIQPNQQIKDMIKSKIERKKQITTTMKNFMSNVPETK